MCRTVIVLAVFAVFGCQTGDKTSLPYVAVVDGEKIFLTEFRDRLAMELSISRDSDVLKDERFSPLREEILQKLLNERMMLQRAKVLFITVNDKELDKKIDEIKKAFSEERFARFFSDDTMTYDVWRENQRRRMILEKLIEKEVNSKISVTDEEVGVYLKDHGQKNHFEKRIHVLQIFLYKKDRAELVLKRLKEGEDFGKVAKKESMSPEAAKGGDLGYISPGVMPEVVDKTIFSLPAGEISGVIKSPYGYHIFKVVERSDGENEDLSDLYEKTRENLLRAKEDAAYQRWMKSLREKADVKINHHVFNSKS